MKKLITLIFLLPLLATAQDTLVTIKGVVIPCEVYTLYPEYMVYKSQSGEFVNIRNSDVQEKVINSKPFIVGTILSGDSVKLAQNKVNNINLAGRELKGAARTWFAGFAVTMIGAAVAGGGAALLNKSPGTAKGMLIGGGTVSFIGGVTMAISFSNISRAGDRLEAYRGQ